jgi:hypothetical protein
MAIWQFKITIVPSQAMIEKHGRVLPVLMDHINDIGDGHQLLDSEPVNYWVEANVLETSARVGCILPEVLSWSNKARMFGYDGGDWIEVWPNNVECRIDCRKINDSFVSKIVEFASDWHLLLYNSRDGKIIENSKIALIASIEQSISKLFVGDPGEGFRVLDNLARVRKRDN